MIKSTFNNITIVIVTYKSSEVIFKCLKNVSKFKNILILDNSNDTILAKKIKKNFKNVKIILSKKNIGYAKGNNILLRKVKTEFSLILNPDCFFSYNEIFKVYNFAQIVNEKFLAIGTKQSASIINAKTVRHYKYYECNYIKGHLMFLNMKNVKKVNYFDENFFLYLEEIDFCKRGLLNGYKILALDNLKFLHLAARSSNDRKEFVVIRNKAWMWSQYYFYKKYNGLFRSIIKFLPKLSILYLKKMLFPKNIAYQARYTGLYNSLLSRKN